MNKKPYSDGVSRYMELSDYSTKYLDALNLKYLLAIQKNDDESLGGGHNLSYRIDPKKYKRVFEDKNTVVLENTQFIERAYFMKKVTAVATKQQMIEKLENPLFDPTEEAIIVSNKSFPEIETAGNINFVKYSPNEIILKTTVPNMSFLTLAESYNDGWHVTRDGLLDTLYEVNGALRGVEVPEGKHTFVFTYYPSSFDSGLKLSLVSLFLLSLISIFALRTKKL